MTTSLIEYFTARKGETVALLRQLVEMESPTESKAAIDRLGTLITLLLRDLGAGIQTAPQTTAGDHLVASFGDGDRSPIVTLCHIDTVWPIGTLDKLPWREEDGKLHGPGAYDMKAGTAMLLTALRYLRETGAKPAPPLRMLFPTDEE